MFASSFHGFLETTAVWIHTNIWHMQLGISTSICLLLFFSPLWPILIVYLFWMLVFDFDVAENGGRRCRALRNGPLAKYSRDYFDGKLIKTANLCPDCNYIVGGSPHGAFVNGTYLGFASNATNFESIFPGMKCYVFMKKFMYWLPFTREYILGHGGAACTEKSLKYIFNQEKKGNFVVISLGFSADVPYAYAGSNEVAVRSRNTFFRLALKTGAKLVPSYAFGENELYTTSLAQKGSWLYSFQLACQKVSGVMFPLPRGRLFNLPYRRKVTTVVGAPIDVPRIEHPSEEDVDKYRERYIEGLKYVFNKYKKEYHHDPNAELIIR